MEYYSKLERIARNCLIKPIKIVTLATSLYLTSKAYSKEIYIPKDYPTIQTGIDVSVNGDRVIVSQGRYNELIDFRGKAITLKGLEGPEATVIDGSGLDDSVVKCTSGETQDTILDGFTITRGTGKSLEGIKCGGGMVNLESSPTVSNCIFLENIAGTGPAGGIGGGVYNRNSNFDISNCYFIDNKASNGAGMRNDSSNVKIENCKFLSNISFNDGGGLVNLNSSSVVSYCIFANNKASGDGGALFNNGELSLLNCTIAKNSSRYGGGLIEEGQSTIINCIFHKDSGSPILGRYGGSALISYSNFQGGSDSPELGNMYADPLFVDENNGDYHLQSNSPCIDTGDPESPKDPDGTRADMGALFYDHRTYFIRGDADKNEAVQLTDAIYILNWLFKGGEEPKCLDAADADDNGKVDLADAVKILNHLFKGDPDLPTPYPEAGIDPTEDELSCAA